jgi:parallel beta-helix repeat protein
MSTLTSSFSIRLVRASGTIYIRADGSIDPPTAPISTADNITYTSTGNITSDADGIVIERDNMTFDGAGYTIQGGSGKGIDLSERTNVTILNTKVTAFEFGICLSGSSNDIISQNSVTANQHGIYLDSSSGNNISRNNMTGCGWSIYLGSSSDKNTIHGNGITAMGGYGILLQSSSNNTLYGNNMTTLYGFDLYDSSDNNIIYGNNLIGGDLFVYNSYQNVVESNVVNNAPLVYLECVSDSTVESDAGQVILVNCNNITVENLDLSSSSCWGLELEGTTNSKITNNNVANKWYGIITLSSSNNAVYGNNITNNGAYGVTLGGNIIDPSENNTVYGNNMTGTGFAGVFLAGATNNIVYGNNITNSGIGVQLNDAWNNTIYGNNITDNTSYHGGYGVWIDDDFSSGNEFYHNNFVDNGAQVGGSASVNVWDKGYPSGGNYWSDYNGSDLFCGPFQNVTGSDGIVDTPYVIDANNQDSYPLTNPWSAPRTENASSGGETYPVGLSSNATISNFSYNESDCSMSLGLSGESGSQAYCRLVYPKQLMNNTLAVLVNGTACDYSITDNSTHFFLYFTYHLSYDEVLILQTVLGDINGDRKVDVKDVYAVAKAYGSSMEGPDPPGHPWKPICDINNDGKVDVKDYYTVCKNYGKTYP